MSSICKKTFEEKINLISDFFESIEFDHPEMNNADKTFYLLRVLDL